jgi:hypothetical protein
VNNSDGFKSIYLETHSWPKTAAFLQALGFTIDFSGDDSGLLRTDHGPHVFVQEIPADRNPDTLLVLGVADAAGWQPGEGVDITHQFQQTSWGVWEMKVRDPDGRTWSIHAQRRSGEDSPEGT